MSTKVFEYGKMKDVGPSLVHCQRDSYIRQFESTVIGCNEWSLPSDVDNKRKGKKKKKKKEKFYEIELKDTILFPEGGGQPTDLGKLIVMSAENDSKQNDIDIDILSVHRTPKGRVIHKSTQKAPIGSKVSISLDYERRYDQMQQHSAQHLISAIFRSELQTPTISWWMSEYPKASLVEMQIENKQQKITKGDILRCEALINKIISAAKPMTVHIFYDDASIEKFASSHPTFKSKALPDGAGPLRVIEIEGIEYNTCCGTHLSSTSELNMVKIVSWDVSAKDNLLKIHFVSGKRVIANYEAMFLREREIGKLLSCGNEEYVSNIDKLQNEMKAKTSLLRGIEKRLIELEIKRLHDFVLNDDGVNGEDVRCVYEHFVNGNTKMLQGISDGLLTKIKEDKSEIIIFLMFSMGVSTKNGQYIMATNDDKLLSPKNKECKKKIMAIIEGSGGGRPGRLQGKASNLRSYAKLFEYVKSLFPSSQKKDKTDKCRKSKDVLVNDALSGLNDVISALEVK